MAKLAQFRLFMITRLHHLAIIGSDKEASLHFYRDLLGFDVVGEYYQEGRESWKIDLVMPGGG